MGWGGGGVEPTFPPFYVVGFRCLGRLLWMARTLSGQGWGSCRSPLLAFGLCLHLVFSFRMKFIFSVPPSLSPFLTFLSLFFPLPFFPFLQLSIPTLYSLPLSVSTLLLPSFLPSLPPLFSHFFLPSSPSLCVSSSSPFPIVFSYFPPCPLPCSAPALSICLCLSLSPSSRTKGTCSS